MTTHGPERTNDAWRPELVHTATPAARRVEVGDRVCTRTDATLNRDEQGKVGTITAIYPGVRYPYGVKFDDEDVNGFGAGVYAGDELEPATSAAEPVPSPVSAADPTAADLFYAPKGLFTHEHYAAPGVEYHGGGRAVDVPMTPEQKAAGEEYARAIMAGEGERYFNEHLSDADRALLAAADAEDAASADLADFGEKPELHLIEGGGHFAHVHTAAESMAMHPAGTGHMRRAHEIAMDRLTEVLPGVEAFQADIEHGLRRARHLEDLDHAAQAVVDAADEWEAAPDSGRADREDALVDAVLAWRAARDGVRR